MKLHTLIATKSDCYKTGKTIQVKGLMLHSTGANNPKLSRYVGPDDGILGPNKNNNHWNTPGIDKCVHGFIGLDKDGEVRTYQTLPWIHRGWHAGGSANNTHVGLEICEDDTNDPEYFKKVYQEAVEVYAYLCDTLDLDADDIIDHREGHAKGIASNHGDVKHWFSKHGKTMDDFRDDVAKLLHGKPVAQAPVDVSGAGTGTVGNGGGVLGKSISDLANEVLQGKHGSGEDRKKSLGAAYDQVQAMVNSMVNKPKPQPKSISQLADEVMRGLHGSGRERMLSLGTNYTKVQQEVNKRMKARK